MIKNFLKYLLAFLTKFTFLNRIKIKKIRYRNYFLKKYNSKKDKKQNCFRIFR